MPTELDPFETMADEFLQSTEAQVITDTTPEEVDPFEQMATQFVREEENQLKANVYTGMEAQPDNHAKALKLSTRVGLPSAYVLENMPAVERQDIYAQIDFAKLLSENKAVAQYLGVPDNAKISHDDIEGLSAIENMLRGGGERMRTLGSNLIQFIANTADAGEDVLADLTGINPGVYWDDDGLHWSWNLPTGSDTSLAAALRDGAEVNAGDLGYQQNFTWERLKGDLTVKNLAGYIVEQGVQSVPDMVAALMTLPAYIASRTEEIAETRVENDNRERVSGSDLSVSLIPAVFISALERIGVQGIINPVITKGLTSTAGRRILTAGAKEAATEFVQENIEYAAGTVGTAKGYDLAAGLDQGFAGAVAGGGMGAGGRTLIEGANAVAALRHREQLRELGEAVRQSKTFERHKDKLVEFMQSVDDGNVFLDAGTARTFFQANGEDPDAVFEALGVTEQVSQAEERGADIAIPSAKLMGMADQPWFDDILMDVRQDPGQMTAREAELARTQLAEQWEAEADRVLEQQAENNAFQESAYQVRQSVYDNLVETQRFDDTTADAYASLWESFFVAMADRSGTLPHELFAQYYATTTTPDQQFQDLVGGVRSVQRGEYPKQREIFGASLAEWLADRGGVRDDGGELAAMDLELWHHGKPGQRRLVSEEGDTLDGAAQAAQEAGYLTVPYEEVTPRHLLDALNAEMAGDPTYSEANLNLDLLNRQDWLESIAREMESMEELAENADPTDIALALSESDGSALFQSGVPKANDHVKARVETDFEALASEDLIARVSEHEGTAWAREVKKGVIYRDEIVRVAEGELAAVDAVALQNSGKLARLLEEKGWEGAWEYLAQGDVIGSAAKPVHAVNSSLQNCRPSKDCAKYCYACKGRHAYPASKTKAELVDLMAERDPDRLGDMIAKSFRSPDRAGLHWRDTALRLFDIGDGTPAWNRVIDRLNAKGIRTHVFSKNPEFLANMDERNVRLLSLDKTNEQLAEDNDLPVAMVYDGTRDVEVLEQLGDRVQVILPVVENGKLLSGDEIDAIPKKFDKALCPIDAGKAKLDNWNCLNCDKTKSGQGCLNGQKTGVNHFGGVKAARRQQKDSFERVAQEVKTLDDIQEIKQDLLRQLAELEAQENQFQQDNGPAVDNDRGNAQGRSAGSTGGVQTVDPQSAGAAGSQGENPEGLIATDREYSQNRRGSKGHRGKITLPAGGVRDGRSVITLFDNADLSTFLHESGHFFLEVYRDMSTREDAPETIKQDMAQLLAWFGVESVAQIDVEQHEQFARGFEAYLREGKAPSVGLRAAFERFSAWLKHLYKSIRNLNVDLTDEVRGVMDRMLATDAAIENARQSTDLFPMFDDAESAGMTEAEFNAYRASYEKARVEAESDLRSKMMSEMWRETQRAWRMEKNQLRDQFLEGLMEQPVYQVRRYLTEAEPHGKLSLPALKALYGTGPEAPWRKLPFGSHALAGNDGGTDPQQLAELFGFRSGDEMVRAMVEAGNPKAKALAMAEAEMRRLHGDISGEVNQAAQAAMDALHANDTASFLTTELRVMERKAGLEPTLKDSAKNAARRILAGLQVGNLQEYQYLMDEQRHGKAAIQATAAGDFAAAADAQRKRLLAHYLYLEARKAKEEIEKGRKYFTKFERANTRKSLERYHLDQIDAILEAYSFKKSVTFKEANERQRLAEWIAEQEDQGMEVVVDPAILEKARSRHYKTLTLEAFRGLRDAVKNIEHLARLQQRQIDERNKQAFKDLVADLKEEAKANNTLKPEPIEFDNTGKWHQLKKWGQWLLASHMKMEFLATRLDGEKTNGKWWNAIIRPLADAADKEQQMQEMATAKLNEVFGRFSKADRRSWHTNKFAIDVLGIPDANKSMVFSIALNWGNEGNRQALMQGYGWERENVEAALNRYMTAEDWRLVQDIWGHIDSYWPQIAELQKDLTGVVPEQVERSPFVTDHGEMAGGYFPLVYDPEKNWLAGIREEKNDVKEMFGGNHLRPSTRKGHTKERVGSGGQKVRLDVAVVSEHITAVIHDLTHRKAILEIDRLTQNEEIRNTISRIAGTEVVKQIRPWLANIAKDSRPKDIINPLAPAVGKLRRGATVVNMGWKFTTAIVQPLGYFQSVELLGAKWALKGLARFYGNPLNAVKMKDMVFEKSTMMRNRNKTFDRDVRDSINAIKGNSALDNLERTYFAHIGFMDLSVSIPTWIGAYEKFLAEGMEEADAVANADRIVRMSQSAGGAKDLAGIQQGDEIKRAFVMFYSYFSVLHNLLRRRGSMARREGVSAESVAKTTMSALYLLVLPAVLTELVLGRGPEEDEDEEFLPWALKLSASYPASTVVGLRDAVNYWSTGYSYSASPVGNAIEETAKAGSAVYDQLFDEDKEWDRGDNKHLFLSAGYWLGLPTRQLWISGEHLYSVLNDEEEFSFYEFLYRNRRD